MTSQVTHMRAVSGTHWARRPAVVRLCRPTPARPGPDLAGFLVGHLETNDRRRHENRLLEMYYSVLIQHGITGYSFEQCWDDYRTALVMSASQLATAVGYHPGLTLTPAGFWNVVFPRYAQALADLGVAELLQRRYG